LELLLNCLWIRQENVVDPMEEFQIVYRACGQENRKDLSLYDSCHMLVD
jgi:hypothetical protein